MKEEKDRSQQRYDAESGARLVAVGIILHHCVPTLRRLSTPSTTSSESPAAVEQETPLPPPPLQSKEMLCVAAVSSRNNKGNLTFPKGGWETHEPLHIAAMRESHEEGGFVATLHEQLIPMRWKNMAASSSSSAVADARPVSSKGASCPSRTELEQMLQDESFARQFFAQATRHKKAKKNKKNKKKVSDRATTTFLFGVPLQLESMDDSFLEQHERERYFVAVEDLLCLPAAAAATTRTTKRTHGKTNDDGCNVADQRENQEEEEEGKSSDEEEEEEEESLLFEGSLKFRPEFLTLLRATVVSLDAPT